MKNFYVILIVVSVVAGLALGYGIWGKDKASLEKLQKVMEEKEVTHSRTLAESEELRNISEELRGKISGLETDNDEFKDILKKIDELIGGKIEREVAAPANAAPAAAAPAEPEDMPVVVPTPAVPVAEPAPEVKAAPAPESVPVEEPAPEVKASPAEAAPVAEAITEEPEPVPEAEVEAGPASEADAAPADAVPADAAPADAVPADGAATSTSEPGSVAEPDQEGTEASPALEPVPELKSVHPPIDKAL
ncbi:hypothetical protein MNBD_DELTA01-552 [hydrothermal vent metagenome]|uniref:Uncharacterized protein n=1 Tax=hydrothermal vent metagenome TaxID=652676 RepID=A0A3B0QQW3_9ZZZZ